MVVDLVSGHATSDGRSAYRIVRVPMDQNQGAIRRKWEPRVPVEEGLEPEVISQRAG
jgi:hypothetical protein